MDTLLHTPDGVRDIYGRECAIRTVIGDRIQKVCLTFGFDRIETPDFEFFDVFNSSNSALSSREMYKFFDRENNTLVLRPDFTPAVARCVSKYFHDEKHPLRFFYCGNVYRNQVNYRGSQCQSLQVGAELIGDSSIDAEVEMIVLAIECLRSAGLKDFQVEIGEVNFYRGLVEEAELTPEEDAKLLQRIENKNTFGVEEFVDAHVKDEGLKRAFSRIPTLFGGIDKISDAAELTQNRKALSAIDRLEKIASIVELYGYSEYVSYDLGMLSQHDYYTGTIFKVFSYGTGDYIVTGGRYDSLVKRFGKDTPAVGFGLHIDRLQETLRRQKIEVPVQPIRALIIYRKRCTAEAVRRVREFRSAGERVVADLKRPGITREEYQEYADQIGAEELIILNGEEA